MLIMIMMISEYNGDDDHDDSNHYDDEKHSEPVIMRTGWRFHCFSRYPGSEPLQAKGKPFLSFKGRKRYLVVKLSLKGEIFIRMKFVNNICSTVWAYTAGDGDVGEGGDIYF